MVSSTLSPTRIGLNRATFGATLTDVTTVEQSGWSAWVSDQLTPPPGDDPLTAQLLSTATLRIRYRAKETAQGGWDAVDEERTLDYLNLSALELWEIYEARNKTMSGAEFNRIPQEVVAATWIRNTHSQYQLREMLTDFWHNHFNVAIPGATNTVRPALPIYDQQVIRANALGNFRTLLGGVAQSPPMLFYLDNAVSRLDDPNENYARELLELHTLGEDGYLGQGAAGAAATSDPKQAAAGFTDGDVIEVARALTGWTVGSGRRRGRRRDGRLPLTGEFHYESLWHDDGAASVMGVDLTDVSGQDQGERVLDVAAYHPQTAEFITGKMLQWFWGPSAPASVQETMVSTWMAAQDSPDQMAQTLEVMLLDPGFTQGTPEKVRRPYQKTVAFLRTTSATVDPHSYLFNALKANKDTLFTWPAPNGAPDVSGYWLNATASRTTWDALLRIPNRPAVDVSITNQSLATDSAMALVDDWLEQMTGVQLSQTGYDAILDFAMNDHGVKGHLGLSNANENRIERGLRQMVSLIATADEFASR